MGNEDGTTMNDERVSNDGQESGGGISLFAKGIVVLSIVLMLAGAGLKVMAMVGGDDEPNPSTADASADVPAGLAPNGFAPSDTAREGFSSTSSSESDVSDDALDVWSPALFKLGFSFFVGFCVGYALRTFVKVSIIGIGLILLVLLGLQYGGLVDIKWAMMEQRYDGIAEWLKTETTSFTRFVRGALPSAASVTGGLVMGFRRKG